ncbi:hypothetical protein [Methylobacterium fujisawaense]|uniref:hypothetical protein n=1 Tax=Methylobacterium fujisawaense TaxID=107400 RepID=UPI002F35E0CE
MTSEPEVLIDDPSPTLLKPVKRATIEDATDIVGRRLNDAHHHARATRDGARALDAAGQTEKAIAAHAAADAKEWEASCLEAALARLQAMEPYDGEIRDWIKARRAKDAKKTTRPRQAVRRSA